MFGTGWSFLVLVAGATAEANAVADAAAGRMLYQTAIKAAGPVGPSPQGPSPLRDVPDEELLADGDGTVQARPPVEQTPPQGLALLRADLEWLLEHLHSFGADVGSQLGGSHRWVSVSLCLAWMTALASFGLVRSLLRSRCAAGVSQSTKCLDEAAETCQEAKVRREEVQFPVIDFPAPRRVFETPDVTNPVRIQRANEQAEEAARRAEQVKNAQKDHRDVFGCSALHMAAHNGHSEDVAQLLSAGFDANAQDHFGETPLHMVARSGCHETAALLLRHGADPARRNSFGKTAATVAMQHDRELAAILCTRC